MAVTALAEEVQSILSAAVDGAFYRAAYPDLNGRVDPLTHYAQAGWREGRDPAPWFSTTAYLAANEDVRQAGVEPLHHYLTQGWREGREVAPSPHGAAYLLALARSGDSPAWRFEPLAPGASTPDEIEAEMAAIAAAEAARAAAEAAAAAAAAEAEAAAAAEAEAAEVAAAAAEAEMAAAAHHAQRDLVAAEFDAAYYVAANRDVVADGIDPLDHFLTVGWREGRDPSRRFSLKEYLDTYPDIAEAQVNPFVHFLQSGRAEGRMARNELGFRYEIIDGTIPVAERVARAARASSRVKTADAAVLAQALAESRTGLRDLHITFSHDDYTTNTGGVQLCLQREDARLVDLGRDHLHVYPAKPWPVVRVASERGCLGIVLNGRNVGVFSPQDIADTLRAAASAIAPGARTLAVHSLLGHAVDETVEIAAAAGVRAGFFWLHDFASLCAGYHLLRDDVEDCSAPPPDSAACGVCIYGPWRARHLAEHERLFRSLDLTVVGPSEPTLELWRRSWSFPAKEEIVHPHARLVERAPAPAAEEARPFRLAYAGMPASHKGWPIFLDLLRQHAGDPRYTFLHLGGQALKGLPVEFHKVVVTGARPRAMQQALETLEVDAVLLWPLCRETFSFAAYEAAAAGAAIITGPDSGNIAAFVQASGYGWVLPDEAALSAALESGEITALGRAGRKPMLYDLEFSGVSVDLLAREDGR